MKNPCTVHSPYCTLQIYHLQVQIIEQPKHLNSNYSRGACCLCIIWQLFFSIAGVKMFRYLYSSKLHCINQFNSSPYLIKLFTMFNVYNLESFNTKTKIKKDYSRISPGAVKQLLPLQFVN